MELKHRQILSAQVDLSKFNKANFEKATDEEKKQQDVMGESTTFFKDGMRRLRKNPLAMGSIIVLVLILLTIIIAPHICPYKYSEIISVNGVRDKSAANLGPFEYSKLETKYMNETGEKLFPHIFGTDSLSRDYFIRVIYGTRVSLSVGVVASIMVLIIGLLYGSIAGYFGGKVDLIMMRIVDIIYSLPDMLIIILLSVVFNETLKPLITGTVLEKLGTNMISMFIVFGLLYWVSMARLKECQNPAQTYPAELSVRYHYYDSTSGAECNFYRKLSEFPWPWCICTAYFPRKSGKRCQSRHAVLPT